MRLHTALEYFKDNKFRSLEPWRPEEPAELARYIEERAPQTVEFSFSFIDPDKTDETLQVFIDFSNHLWDAEIAPLPHDFFWVSWSQKILQETVNFAAFCERVKSAVDGKVIALSMQVMFETKNKTGLVFVNQSGHKVIGDHKRVLVGNVNSDAGALMTDNGFGVVAALIGALSTRQAIRRDEPAPDRLNKQRERKGRPPIRSMIVIDVRANHMSKSDHDGSSGQTVIPHWRRGHTRTLADGRIIPVEPCWVNVDGDLPPPPRAVRVNI
ncbi:hypothetical protein CFBP4996_26355 (plasmid) [Agrobacterium leguminum]|uniref:hypothetical protein n=1 Tax=Agrobacterium leguminum TaxID=2792015 RepID=UPI0010CA01DD|nr:hypothetical protein [Agrobacterium leguminum]WFS69598.1 hypothetical protein CFBP4996_26355 [Agrobacterium leguminum]